MRVKRVRFISFLRVINKVDAEEGYEDDDGAFPTMPSGIIVVETDADEVESTVRQHAKLPPAPKPAKPKAELKGKRGARKANGTAKPAPITGPVSSAPSATATAMSAAAAATPTTPPAGTRSSPPPPSLHLVCCFCTQFKQQLRL